MSFIQILKLVGLAASALLFMAGAINLFQPRDENTKATASLGLSLLCWATLPIIVGVSLFVESMTTVIIMWNAIVWVMIIIAICLATIHLLDFSDDDLTTTQNHKPAWKSLAVSLCFILTTGMFVYYQENSFFNRFLQKETDQAILVNAFNETYDSESFYYSVLGVNSGWKYWKGFESDYRDAEFGLEHEESAYFVVIPIFMPDEMPETEVLAKATAPLINVQANEPWKGKWERHQQNGFEGFVFDFEKKVQSATYSYKMKVLNNQDMGYMVAAWSDNPDPARREVLLNSIQNRVKLTFDQASSALPARNELTAADHKRTSRIYENIGYEYLKNKDYDKSIAYLKKAHKNQEQNSSILGSILFAQVSQNHYDQAKAYLLRYLERYPEGQGLYETLEDLEKETDGSSTHQGEKPEYEPLDDETLAELFNAFGELPIFDLDDDYDPHTATDYDDDQYRSPTKDYRKSKSKSSERKASQNVRFQKSSFQKTDTLEVKQDPGGENIKLIREIHFEPNRAIQSTEHKITKIKNQETANNFQYLYIPFDGKSQRIEMKKLVLKNSNGQTVYEGDPRDYQIVDGAGNHTGLKVLSVTLPSVPVGGTLETHIVWTAKRTSDRFGYFEYGFATEYETKIHEFILKGKTDSILSKTTRDVQVEEGNGLIKWSYHHDETQSTSTQATARVWIGDKTRTWDEEGKLLYKALSPNFEQDAEITQFSRSLVLATPDKSDRIKVMVDYTRQALSLDPTPLPFGDRYQFQYDFSQVENTDSLFHALYLKKMLQAISVKSHIALMRIDGVLHRDIPSLEQFNHAILYLPKYPEAPFIDPSYKEEKDRMVKGSFFGYEAFILHPKEPFFERIGN